MTTAAHGAAAWIYRGVWGVLVGLFRVPAEPPSLPAGAGQRHEAFQPSDGYLRYLKFQFWIVLLLVDVVLTAAWLAGTWALLDAGHGAWALLLAPVALAIIVVPDVVAYIAIHLRYDTMWYVLTDRSLRIRRGLWIIHEVTITFENVQNVTVEQGPLERWFGIASVMVDTAGGGGGMGTHEQTALTHRGVIEGVANAPEIRALILARARASGSAGLGDERSPATEASRGRGGHGVPGALDGGAGGDTPVEGGRPGNRWGPEHLAVLRSMRDELRATAAARS
jgi:membrane protein YdbS with pleckstrin-like domain